MSAMQEWRGYIFASLVERHKCSFFTVEHKGEEEEDSAGCSNENKGPLRDEDATQCASSPGISKHQS